MYQNGNEDSKILFPHIFKKLVNLFLWFKSAVTEVCQLVGQFCEKGHYYLQLKKQMNNEWKRAMNEWKSNEKWTF